MKHTRRDFIKNTGKASLALIPGLQQFSATYTPQRVIILMIDGLGLDYISNSDMPTLQRWKQQGLYKTVQSAFPSVTNLTKWLY